MKNFWTKEPALITQIVNLAVTITASIGLDLSAEQILAVFSLCSTIAGFIIRSRVSPSA